MIILAYIFSAFALVAFTICESGIYTKNQNILAPCVTFAVTRRKSR